MSYRCHCGCEKLRNVKLYLSDKRAYEVGTNLTIGPVDYSCGRSGGANPSRLNHVQIRDEMRRRAIMNGKGLPPGARIATQEERDANNKRKEEERQRITIFQ